MDSNLVWFTRNLKLLDACCHIAKSDDTEHQVPEGPLLVIARSGCDTVRVRRAVTSLLIVAWLHGVSGAQSGSGSGGDSDREVTPASRSDTVENSPWIDLAPAKVLVGPGDSPKEDHRLSSAIEFGSIYTAFTIWAYLAYSA